MWAKGIESNDYFLKLCGSGGGGYILGFSEDFEKAISLRKQRDSLVAESATDEERAKRSNEKKDNPRWLKQHVHRDPRCKS